MVGIEEDGCAVLFKEYVDIDNDLITFVTPTDQEIMVAQPHSVILDS